MDFTLTWATTSEIDPKKKYEQAIHTYYGNRTAIFELHFLLTKQLNYPFVTVRDKMGRKVDMSAGLIGMPLYDDNCLL